MSTWSRALAALSLSVAIAPACRTEPRNRGAKSASGGGGASSSRPAAHEGGHAQEHGKVGADDGVVFFPAGAIERLKQKSAKFDSVRARLDASIAHARKEMGTRPNALSDIKSEGVARGKRDTGKIVAEFDKILDFALASVLTGEKGFLDQADTFLTAWATTYESDGNPIDEYHFVTYVMAYELVRGQLPAASREKVGGLLLAIFDAEKEFVTRGKGFEIHGNWVSHHATLCAAIAFLRKDPEQIAYVEGVYKGQLSNNILDAGRFGDFVKRWPKRTKEIDNAPNIEVERGTTFDFVHRDALSYHLESISALLVTAMIAKNNGLPWLEAKGDQGQTLWWGYDFVIPYATGEKKHYEFDKTLHDPDRKNKEKRWFKPEDGLGALTFASAVHPEYKKFRSGSLPKNDDGFICYTLQTPADEM
jgi:hypothetical protein